jgi:hypothetical protein
MPQALGASVGFFLTAIVLLAATLLLSLVLPAGAFLFAECFAYLGLLFSLFILLFAAAALFARILQATPTGFAFTAVAAVYLAAVAAVILLSIPAFTLTVPLLLLTVALLGPLFVTHFLVTFARE